MKRSFRMRFGFFLLLGILLVLSGCAPLTVARAEQGTITKTIALENRQVIGQTFVPNYNGMTGLEVFIDPKDAAESDGEIRLHLTSFSDRSQDLAEAVLSLRDVNQPGFYRFQFAPIYASNRQDYYFALELSGANRVELAIAPGTVYLDGSMYVDRKPVDDQMAFQIVYDVPQMGVGLTLEALQGLLLLAAALWFMALPGWALLSQFDSGWAGRAWIIRLVFAIAVGLVLYPLLLLWTDVVGLHLGAFYAWAPALLSTGFLLWKNRAAKFQRPQMDISSSAFWADLAFLLLMLMVFAVRFWSIRLLDGGLWGDSFQHTMIAQLIVDQGGLFDSWLPYTELTTFTYHFAFHTWVAVFHWITGLSVAQSTIWIGQILNGLAIMALYPLALRMTRSRWGGIVAILIGGLLMTVPMVYVNWGRYTQLAGQVVAPVAICLLWDWLDQNPPQAKTLAWWKDLLLKRDWGMLFLNVLLWAGLAITHYRIVILALLFFPAYFLSLLTSRLQWSHVKKTAWLGLGSAALFLPWFVHVFGGKMMALFGVVVRKSPQVVLAEDPTARANSLFQFAMPALWMLLACAIIWGLWQRNRSMLIFLCWWIFIFFAANPVWLGLPGEDLIADFTVGIGIYLLIGPMVGAMIGEGVDRVRGWLIRVAAQRAGTHWLSRASEIILVLGLALVGGVGGMARTNDLNIDQHSLMTRPDLRAFTWIRENTPPDSKFLVNAFLAFYNYVAAGNDGGWWLALMTERGSTLPPLNEGIELGPTPDFQKKVNQMVILIRENGIASDRVYQELKDRKITHVYVGQMNAKDLANGNLLRLQDLISSPNFRLVYHEDRVWVFEVR